MRRIVVFGSAAMQCTFESMDTFIPSEASARVQNSIRTVWGRGSSLMAQKPAKRGKSLSGQEQPFQHPIAAPSFIFVPSVAARAARAVAQRARPHLRWDEVST
eukprot:516687-Prymnesium_polylepis.2